jgi:hypothetical protein
MLRKLAAALVLAGLCLPYACDVRPLTGVWDSGANAAMLGVPVLAALLYVLQEFLPPLAAVIERRGPAAHGALRAIFLLFAGAHILAAIQEDADTGDRLGVARAEAPRLSACRCCCSASWDGPWSACSSSSSWTCRSEAG